MSDSFKIASWNVNGIRAATRNGFVSWLRRSGAEVVGLQEVRATEADLPPEIQRLRGWHSHFFAAERKGYSGVGLLSRRAPEWVETRLGRPEFDGEGRLQLARFGALTLVNSYFPNGSGKDRDNGRVPFKLDYYRCLHQRLAPAFEAGEAVVVIGDMNTAVEEIDLARPRENRGTSGFLEEEREELRAWLRRGWVDSFRHLNPTARGAYSWWSQRLGVREKNVGWRIDYALLSPGALPFLRQAKIHPKVLGSDHCPITVELDARVLG